MKPLTLSTFCVAFLAVNATDVLANETGFYVGGWIGSATKEADRSEFEAFTHFIHDLYGYTPQGGKASFDDSELSYSLLVGYRMTRYLAVEGAYARLGAVEHRSNTSGSFPRDAGTINMTTESETSGFSASLLGVWPMSYRWEIYARAGVLFASNTFRTSITARGERFAPAPCCINESFSKGSDEWYAGLGASARLFDIYDLRLEYQRVFDAGFEVTGGEGDIDVASFGVIVTF